MIDTLACHWVPNTFDRVRVTTAHGSTEVPIDHVRRVLGREALEALYLCGSFRQAISARATSRIQEALGVPLTYAQAAV